MTTPADSSTFHPAYPILLAFSILATVTGIATMLPIPIVLKPNILGYFSLCPFAPAASLFCFAAAGISCTIRATFFSPESRAKPEKRNLKLHVTSLRPIGLLLILAGLATFFFVRAELQYSSLIYKTNEAQDSLTQNVIMQASSESTQLKDGSFQGFARNNDVIAEVRLNINASKIVSINVLKAKEMPFQVTSALEHAIIQGQSLAIDVVSGATVSSQVYLEACAAALRQAQ